MTFDEEIDVLKKALEAYNKDWHIDTPYAEYRAAMDGWTAACSADRIGKLLAGLKDARKAAWGGALLMAPQEATLAKALELLKKAEDEMHDFPWRSIVQEEIQAFLSEVQP